MAWYDLAAGITGGLAAGLNQLQDIQLARHKQQTVDQQVLLQQLRDQQAAVADARAAAQARFAALQHGVEFDPASDPDMVRTMGAGAFVKGANGGIMKKTTPAEAKAEMELDEYSQGAGARKIARGVAEAQARQTQQLMDHVLATYGPNWVDRVGEMKPELRRAVGKLFLGSDDALLRNEDTPAGISAAGTMGAAAINAAAQKDIRTSTIRDREEDNRLNAKVRFTEYLKTAAGNTHFKQNKQGGAVDTQAAVDKTYQEWLQLGGPSAGAPASAAPVGIANITVVKP